MKEKIGFCGLKCSECPTFLQTNKDYEQCDGCFSKDERVSRYARICEVRKCAMMKLVKNCAYCKNYPCEKLNKIIANAPNTKTTLDKIRKTL